MPLESEIQRGSERKWFVPAVLIHDHPMFHEIKRMKVKRRRFLVLLKDPKRRGTIGVCFGTQKNGQTISL